MLPRSAEHVNHFTAKPKSTQERRGRLHIHLLVPGPTVLAAEYNDSLINIHTFLEVAGPVAIRPVGSHHYTNLR
ncbi:hypothetical protein J6590_005845 [Homalodisca vitripennis]|nr:hypothetical protein J6590_005845 [Homalodisca vitripennis]